MTAATAPAGQTRALIDALVAATGAADPVAAIRLKAEQALDAYVAAFGPPDDPPLDLITLASFLGIRPTDEPPAFSPDAELAPDGDGGVKMRVNPDQPETRRRFSVGHEITHTFFPDHASHVWPRADSRHRNLADPDDYLEMLCDVGAAELVLPRRWFAADAAGVAGGADLLALAARYKASREATARRYAELHADAAAAVFFAWKLKPTQKPTVGRTDQLNLLGVSPADEVRDALRLRIEYAIPSQAFAAAGLYLPRDKSVGSDGPLYAAAATGQPADGECQLDLGQARGRYRVFAVPLWTAAGDRGPDGENAVAAVIFPTTAVKPKPRREACPGLFD